MSVQAISWALGTAVGDTGAKLLLLALANYADEHGECWPSQARLAQDTELTDRTIRTKLKLLEEGGFLSRERRQSDAGWRTSDYYRLHLSQPENTSGRSKAPTGNSCKANRKTVSDLGEPSKEPSITVANATVRELKTDLVWKSCPRQLVSLGLTERTARSNLGRWLKNADPDRVLNAVDAARRVGTQDPIPYIESALKPKSVRREGDHWFVDPGTEEFEAWHKDCAQSLAAGADSELTEYA